MPKCPNCRESVGRNDNFCIECGTDLKEDGGGSYDRDDNASDRLKKLSKDMKRVKEILDDKFADDDNGDDDGDQKDKDKDDDDRGGRRRKVATKKKRRTLFGS